MKVVAMKTRRLTDLTLISAAVYEGRSKQLMTTCCGNKATATKRNSSATTRQQMKQFCMSYWRHSVNTMGTPPRTRPAHKGVLVINHQCPGSLHKRGGGGRHRSALGRWAACPRLLVSPGPRNPVYGPAQNHCCTLPHRDESSLYVAAILARSHK